jgi:rfaE bifunctional protein kinase chain/domain
MTTPELTDLLTRLAPLRIGVIGDFAVDFYYEIQQETGETSLETGLEVHWGRCPRTAPGGAGNVVQNLTALGITGVAVFGGVGDDLFGRELRALLASRGVNTTHLLTLAGGWDTCTYTKPMRPGGEDHRLDFGTHNRLPDDAFDALLVGLESALPALDALILNQQFPNPLLNEARLAAVLRVLARFPAVRVVADSRDFGNAVRGAVLKVNTAELARLLGVSPAETAEDCFAQAQVLRQTTGGPVVVTRGANGILYADERQAVAVPGLTLAGPLDPVGAGDTVVAALTAALAAGATPAQALHLANRAAAVTVRKLGQTGTATPEEILAIA